MAKRSTGRRVSLPLAPARGLKGRYSNVASSSPWVGHLDRDGRPVAGCYWSVVGRRAGFGGSVWVFHLGHRGRQLDQRWTPWGQRLPVGDNGREPEEPILFLLRERAVL